MLFRSVLITAIALTGSTAGPAQASCTVPVLAMFNICSPFLETSVPNPVQVSVSATPPQDTLASLQLWVDGTKYMNSTTNTLTGPLPVMLTSGKHRFTFVLISNSPTGAKIWNSIVYVNVQ